MWNYRYSTAGEVKVNQNKIAIVVNSSSCVWGGACVRALGNVCSVYLICSGDILYCTDYIAQLLCRAEFSYRTSWTINTTTLLLVRTSARHNLDLLLGLLEARRIWCFNQINNRLTRIKLERVIDSLNVRPLHNLILEWKPLISKLKSSE